MKVNNFEEYFKKAFQGLDISEDEEKQIKFIFMVQIYKSMMELLMTLKGTDKTFVEGLIKFFDDNIKSLDPQILSNFEKVMEEERSRIASSMVKTILATAPEDQKKIIEKNLVDFR